jgi:hypothetical protein
LITCFIGFLQSAQCRHSRQSIAANDQVLLQVGYFIMSSPEQLPNNDLKIEDNN